MTNNVKVTITGDLATGNVRVDDPTGAILDMRIAHWLLGEARRVVEAEADKRDREHGVEVVQVVRPGLKLDEGGK